MRQFQWNTPRNTRLRRDCAVVMVAIAGLLLGGCTSTRPAIPLSQDREALSRLAPWNDSHLVLPERLDRGYTLVLPGAWGDVPLDYGIVLGLKDADVQSAVELYDWTAGTLMLVYSLRGLDRNRNEAEKIAAKITLYQDRYPGRPVHLIGYSGGGGVAVLALEALPPDRKITNAILMAPTLASDYDLRPALNHTERGIRNFYSPLDVPVLMMLGTAVGTTEGRHTLAAGTVGFRPPEAVSPSERTDYESRLPQNVYDFKMAADGNLGGHFGWSNRTFVARHVAPLIDAPASTLR